MMRIMTATLSGAVELAESPSPPPAGGYSEPWEVSPGVTGFLAFFVLGLALIVIARFMMRSVRRVDHAGGWRPSAPVPAGGIDRPGPGSAEPPADAEPVDADGHSAGAPEPGDGTAASARRS